MLILQRMISHDILLSELFADMEKNLNYLRSLLFIPGNQAKMLGKAAGLMPDAFIPDLEDSVAPDDKDEAREIVSDHIDVLSGNGVRVLPRVNSLDTGLLEADLEAVIGPNIFGITVGKIQLPEHIEEISSLISRFENSAGLKDGSLKLIPWIESALGVVKAYDILTASPRIYGAAFGAEDFTNDMGIERTDDDSEILHATNAIAIAARAANVIALDTPFVSFRDEEGLVNDANESKSIGYKGKFAIHPAQITPINTCFSPSPKEIDYATRVLEVFEEAKAQGRGSTSLDGQMIDVPVVKRAEGLLAMAKSMNLT